MLKNVFILFLCLSLSALSQAQEKKDIKLEDIAKYPIFRQQGMHDFASMNDGSHYSVLESNGLQISKYSYVTGNIVDVLIDLGQLASKDLHSIEGYEMSKDESKILLYTASSQIYRHSFFADYYVYDIQQKKLISIAGNTAIRLASLSPDGSKVAYLKDNNIFYTDLNNGQEIQVTKDGLMNSIINGAPDWVYEEEFSFTKAYEWAPDSKSIAFIRFDESRVKSYSMPIYKGAAPVIVENTTYPGQTTYKYPKAGEDNSLISVHVYQLANQATQTIDLGKETNIYVPRIKWANTSAMLCVYRMNRHQNKLEILAADPTKGTSSILYTEENKCYIDEENFDRLYFTEDGKNFIVASEQDGYNHLYLYDISGKLVNQITKGNFVVTDVVGVDSKNKVVYYEAAESSPINREVYCISFNGKKKTAIADAYGTNKVEFSTGFKYYIKTFNDANTPNIITVHDQKGKQIRVIEDNEALRTKLKAYKVSKKKFFQFTTSNGTKLNAWMMYPTDMDSSKSYPVLITQYNGPKSQQVLNKWSMGWENVLTNKGVIVACVDTRGTGARGEAFAKCTYLQLGKYETEDMIETAKYLGSIKYIDKSRIGVWGWSYGGFMALSCITKGADYFKMAIATAPVTNWRYYDNIYTERFMRTPQENEDGYDNNSPTAHASKFKGKLLIVHGSADDNVHLQNTMEMTEALVQANKQFDMQIYTNRNHGIYGGNSRFHVFNKFLYFIDKNL